MYWITKFWPFPSLTRWIVFHGSQNHKRIALTFDDGPSSVSLAIARLLERYNGRGTFFVLGNRIARYSSVLKQLTRQGHELGNHSYDHPAMAFASHKVIHTQVRKTDQLLATHRLSALLIRPPHGSFGIALYRVASQLRRKLILWDVDPADWNDSRSEQTIMEHILSNVRPGSIIDLHEYTWPQKDTQRIIRILEYVLPILRKRGYRFVTVSELLKE